jgi:hypothetical protein
MEFIQDSLCEFLRIGGVVFWIESFHFSYHFWNLKTKKRKNKTKKAFFRSERQQMCQKMNNQPEKVVSFQEVANWSILVLDFDQQTTPLHWEQAPKLASEDRYHLGSTPSIRFKNIHSKTKQNKTLSAVVVYVSAGLCFSRLWMKQKETALNCSFCR